MFKWLRKTKKVTPDEEKLKTKLKIVKDTQTRHKDVRATEDKLANDIKVKQKLFAQVRKDIPQTQKDLKQAQKAVKNAETNLNFIERAAKKASSRATPADFGEALTQKYEFGKAYANAFPETKHPEMNPSPTLALAAAPMNIRKQATPGKLQSAPKMPTAPPYPPPPPAFDSQSEPGDKTLSSWAIHPDVTLGPMILIHRGLNHQHVKEVYPKSLEEKELHVYTAQGVPGKESVKLKSAQWQELFGYTDLISGFLMLTGNLTGLATCALLIEMLVLEYTLFIMNYPVQVQAIVISLVIALVSICTVGGGKEKKD